ncbi:MAG TPA: TIGR04282 family arsenosugar biosynthesis glycosyltransferase [Gammaproteobacteria bacterium]
MADSGNRRLLVFAKAPEPGAVKTRLIPALGAGAAADLHARLLERTLETACSAGVARVCLCCAPDRTHPAFASAAGRWPLELCDQAQGDLGQRMHAALAEALQQAATALLIGSDCPDLAAADLAAAFAALADHDAVLGPAVDGGYYLVGLARPPSPALFAGIDWGGPRVLVQTRARLVALGWRWRELRTLRDVDRPEDLEWLEKSPRT